MDWIRLETGLPDHPKVGRLARRLKVDRDRALAIVVRLLCWVGRMKERGELNGTDPEDLAEVCRWDGEPEQLLTALRGAGWIDSSEAGDVVHDWLQRQSSVFKSRERMARVREQYANGTRTVPQRSDLQTDRQTDRKSARASERDRLPAGGGPVARRYREWEPPR